MSPENDSLRLSAAEVLARYNDEGLPEFCDPLTDVNQVGTFGNRPLHIAAIRRDMNEIRALVEGGADVNAVGDLGSTPLHESVEQDHVEAVAFLLEHGARCNVENEFGETALDFAKRAGQAAIVHLLTSKEPGHTGK